MPVKYLFIVFGFMFIVNSYASDISETNAIVLDIDLGRNLVTTEKSSLYISNSVLFNSSPVIYKLKPGYSIYYVYKKNTNPTEVLSLEYYEHDEDLRNYNIEEAKKRRISNEE
ncbi:PilY2 family type 4a fimbrial biogenesis protein [Pseudomonas sp. F1_0610]|uniref:PilY2 family type 4a fimbrial biogenesis protein n=1 Tax=Pseudomonas sp. F1_0610 TaxID=3114284 RepID=UPI0039C18DDE